MAKFIRDQALILIGKLSELDLVDQTNACKQLQEHADRLYQNLTESFPE